MHTNVLHKFIQLSELSELLVQRGGVAMTTGPEKFHWISHCRKLNCFPDAASLHVGKSPSAISSFLPPPFQPQQLPVEAEGQCTRVRGEPCLRCYRLVSCDNVTFPVSKKRR